MKTRDFSGIMTGGALPDVNDIRPSEDLGELLMEYVDSTDSMLEELERATLAYESGMNLEENAAIIRRVLHKMKGEASMVGMEDISHFCHQTEDAFEELPENKRVDMLLRFKDWVFSAIQILSQDDMNGGG